MQRFVDQGRQNRVEDLRTGRLLLPEEMRYQLGVTRQALALAVREHRMFALDGPQGKKIYPAFFADSRYRREELAKVSRALGGVNGEVKWEFFTTRRESLGGRKPLDALAQGGAVEDVLKSAVAFVSR